MSAKQKVFTATIASLLLISSGVNYQQYSKNKDLYAKLKDAEESISAGDHNIQQLVMGNLQLYGMLQFLGQIIDNNISKCPSLRKEIEALEQR